MARTKPGGAEELDPELLGAEGEICSQCGTKLAVDQRYCLNCGTPRAAPRLDYERALASGGAAGPLPQQGQQAVQWTPLAAVVAIAILGGMLLLGVLIGQDDNSVTVTEVQQSEAGETTSATTETSATTTTPQATTTAPPETTTEALPPQGSGFGAPQDEAGGVGAAP